MNRCAVFWQPDVTNNVGKQFEVWSDRSLELGKGIKDKQVEPDVPQQGRYAK
jgi:hypothetical protein